jgi:hypothetical protein
LQTTSIDLAIPSQWALQYFSLFSGMQEHAVFAHFFGSAMIPPQPSLTQGAIGWFDAGPF